MYSAQTSINKLGQVLAPYWKSLRQWAVCDGTYTCVGYNYCQIYFSISQHQLKEQIKDLNQDWNLRTLCLDRYLYQPLNRSSFIFNQMFAVYPLSWCQHLEEISPLPDKGLDTSVVCEVCSVDRENWVCLTCFHVSKKRGKRA